MTQKLPGNERRASIIDAAVSEFVEKGFERTTMNSVAKRANISKGGIYHHFKNKDSLLAAANARVLRPVMSSLKSFEEEDAPSVKIGAYIDAYLKYWADNLNELTFIFLSISKSMHDPDLFQEYNAYNTYCVEQLTQVYEEGLEKGEFRALEAGAAALALCAGLDGVTLYLGRGGGLNMEDVSKSIKTVFVDAFLKET